MLRWVARLGLISLAFPVLLLPTARAAPAEDSIATCTERLKAIGRALQAYQQEHGRLPPYLSDLVPKHLADTERLNCPADGSPDSPRFEGNNDPKFPSSYLYEMSANNVGDIGVQLGPKKLPAEATWHDRKTAQRVHFGDRLPVVSCFHHERPLRLTLSGRVYPSQGSWETDPVVIPEVLERMERDLVARPNEFSLTWSLGAVQQYAAQWIDTPLPPGLRYGLGVAGDRIVTAAGSLPAAVQGEAYRTAVLFYRGAGAVSKAERACRALARLPGERERAKRLRQDLEWRIGRLKGEAGVDAVVQAAMEKYHKPGMSVAVVRDGKVVLARGYGLANVELNVAATPETVYEIASLTKPFTATALMMLVEEGKLSLDDKVSQYLSDLPAAWQPVTIRQLLNHTSGIKSYTAVPELWKSPGQDLEQAEVLKLVSTAPLHFPPGEKWWYSNTNYFLAGMVIEKVTGKSYGQVLEERIFRPLGMSATRLYDFRDLIPNRATGYTWKSDRLRNVEPWSPTQSYAAGAVASTVLDLAKWDAALYNENLLKQSTLEQMWTRVRLKDGKTVDYGLGWAVDDELGRRMINHSGGFSGFVACLARFVDERLTVIVLTNSDGGYPYALARDLARAYLPGAKPAPDDEPQVSQRLTDLMESLIEWKARPSAFTPEAYAALSAEREATRAFYASLGTGKSLRFLEKSTANGRQTRRYRLTSAQSRWVQSFELTGDGKVARIAVGPE